MTEEYFTNLPYELFYKIMSYAEKPLNIALFVPSTMALLSSSVNEYVQSDPLWEIILGVFRTSDSVSFSKSNRTQRRQSKRLRRTTAKEDVIHAFALRRANVSNTTLNVEKYETIKAIRIKLCCYFRFFLIFSKIRCNLIMNNGSKHLPCQSGRLIWRCMSSGNLQ